MDETRMAFRGTAPDDELATVKRRLRVQRLLTATLTAALLALGIGSAVYATIPDAAKVFHGCYAKSNGALRLIDLAKAGKCTATELPVSWNQKGQKGDQGIPGAQGPGGFVSLVSADLSAMDLRYRNLAGLDMNRANLTNANLKGASLKNANLTGATMAGATVTGVLWDNTTCPDGTNSNSDGNTCVGHLSPHQTVTVHVGPQGNLTYSPSNVTIHVGDTVHWVWDSSFHTVTSGSSGIPDHKFCSPNDDTANCGGGSEASSNLGDTYNHTFASAGTFNYYCRIHGPTMAATVTVQS